MASRRLVFPCPLPPERTLKRGFGSSVSAPRLRNPSEVTARMSKRVGFYRGTLETHRHDDAEVLIACLGLRISGAQKARIEFAIQLELYLGTLHLAEQLDDVLGVESDGEVRPVVAHVEL